MAVMHQITVPYGTTNLTSDQLYERNERIADEQIDENLWMVSVDVVDTTFEMANRTKVSCFGECDTQLTKVLFNSHIVQTPDGELFVNVNHLV